MYLSDFKTVPSRFSKTDLPVRQNIGRSITDRDSKLMTFCSPRRGLLGISIVQHILRVQDPRMQNIPLLVASPGFDQPKLIHGKEIQALTRTSPAKKSEEDLQSLVHEIRSVVEEARAMKTKRGPPKNLGKGRNQMQIVTPSPQNPSRPRRMGQSSRQSQNDQQNDSENHPPIWNAHYGKVT